MSFRYMLLFVFQGRTQPNNRRIHRYFYTFHLKSQTLLYIFYIKRTTLLQSSCKLRCKEKQYRHFRPFQGILFSFFLNNIFLIFEQEELFVIVCMHTWVFVCMWTDRVCVNTSESLSFLLVRVQLRQRTDNNKRNTPPFIIPKIRTVYYYSVKPRPCSAKRHLAKRFTYKTRVTLTQILLRLSQQ